VLLLGPGIVGSARDSDRVEVAPRCDARGLWTPVSWVPSALITPPPRPEPRPPSPEIHYPSAESLITYDVVLDSRSIVVSPASTSLQH